MVVYQCDVVVVGSGVAGLAAGLEAAERGANVIVLEGEDKIGGASAMSGAGCCIVGTPEQAAAHIEDSVEIALRDWETFGGPTADLTWARDYLEHSRVDVYDWCVRLGITWGRPTRQEGNSVARWHAPDQYGVGIVESIAEELRASRGRILTGSSATELLFESDAVSGIVAESNQGRMKIRAGATVIASGGFVNNRGMLMRVSERLRAMPRLLLGGSHTARGSGHEMLERVGAGMTNLDHVWVYPVGTPDPQDAAGERGIGVRNIATELWFNLEGRRFHDESLRGGKSGTDALLEQPEQSCWAVFDRSEASTVLLIDNEYYASPAGPLPGPMEEFWAESPYAVLAGSVEELAELTGLPERSLREDLESFNSDVRAGRASDTLTGRALHGLGEVGRNGFAAIRMWPMAQKNFGGVRTDLECRVLTPEGRVIPGLYAAGEVAGMAGGAINGNAGLEGTMFGPSLYSGRIAGQSVAIN